MRRLITLLLFAASATAQINVADVCDPAVKDVVLQFLRDQTTMITNAGWLPLRDSSKEENADWLFKYLRSYKALYCEQTATTPVPPTGGGPSPDLTARVAALESSLTKLLTGAATVTDVTLTKTSTYIYQLSWKVDRGAVFNVQYGYQKGTTPYTLDVPLGKTATTLAVNPGAMIYVRINSTSLVSGVAKTGDEVALFAAK